MSLQRLSANVPLVDDLHLLVLQECAHLRLAREHRCHQLSGDLLLSLKGSTHERKRVFGAYLVGEGGVPLLQAQLPLPAEEQHELQHVGEGSA